MTDSSSDEAIREIVEARADAVRRGDAAAMTAGTAPLRARAVVRADSRGANHASWGGI